jgi:tetratricopeptide (TPR) repeat protein
VTIIDGAAVPKVIDFGVAKATGAALTERTLYTSFQQFVGTPLYMSPEQADLSGMDVDTRSDIYALGVLLYELLTGTTPFAPETFRQAAFDEVRRIIREQEPPKPSTRLSSLGETRATVSAHRNADARQLDRAVRGELDWIVMRALEKDRRRRYETANDFATDVMRYLSDQPVEACPPSAWYRFAKLARRNRVALVTSTFVATALMLGTAVSIWEAIRATGAERAADTARAAESSARKRAEDAEKTARVEADKATAINEFLVNDLLVRSGEPGKDVDPLVPAEPGEEAAASRITLREALDRAAKKVGERFRGLPLVEAALRTTISDTYHGLGVWAESRQQAAVALAIYEREKGPEAAETLNAVRRLGHAEDDGGDPVEAERLLRRSLDGLRRVLGERHPDTLKAMDDLGGLYRDRGKPAEAEPLLIQAVEIGRHALGEDHPDTVRCMVDLARLYRRQGQWARAEPLLVQAMEVGRRALGEENPATLSAMLFLAKYYEEERQYPKAEPLWVKRLEILRRVLGEEHPDTLHAMHNLAVLFKSQGKQSEAEALFIKALEGYRRVKSEEHRDALHTINCLACLYQDQRKWSQAEPLFVKALEISRRVRGEEDPDRLRFLHNLAGQYMVEQKFAQAEPLFVRALEVRRRVLGEEHPDTLSTMHNLAGVYKEQRKFALAEPLFVRTLEVRRGVLGEEHPDTLLTARVLADLYRYHMMTLERSIPLFERAWAGARKQPDRMPGGLEWIAFELGMAYEQTGRLERAEPLYREALETLRQRHKEASSESAMLQSSLAGNLLKQQRSAEAEPLLRECLNFREQNEANHYVTFYTKSLLGGSLLGQKRYSEAEPLLLAGYDGMKRREAGIPPVRMFRMTEAIERLVQLYEAWGQPEKTAVWRAKLPPSAAELPADVFARP